jgi:hypothetical protein
MPPSAVFRAGVVQRVVPASSTIVTFLRAGQPDPIPLLGAALSTRRAPPTRTLETSFVHPTPDCRALSTMATFLLHVEMGAPHVRLRSDADSTASSPDLGAAPGRWDAARIRLARDRGHCSSLHERRS